MIPSQVFLDDLRKDLRALSYLQQCIFAAAACKRHRHDYAKFYEETRWGDPDVLAQTILICDEIVFGKPLRPLAELKGLRARCDASLPDTEDFALDSCSDALDAMSMAAHLLDLLLDKDPDAAGWIASLAIDVADRKAQANDDADRKARGEIIEAYSSVDAELENRIANSGAMRDELAYLREAFQTARSCQS